MKSARVACGLVALGLFVGCARSPEASAPAASSDADDTRYAAPPAEPAPGAPPPAPAAAAPQSLSEERAEAESPKSDGLQDEFRNLEAAERALNQAKSDLDRLALAQPAPVVGRGRAADGSTEKKDASKGAQTPSASGAGAPTANAVCENACRAFGSLSRAASAVCRLDSSSAGLHCLRAKKLVAESQQRVASCSCPASKD